MNAFNNIVSALFNNIINPILYTFSAFTFLWFLYGVFNFILAKYNGDNDGVTKGKNHMIWGLLGLIIIFSASSIYTLITGFFE